jgi:hypothetical protein
VTIQDEVKFQLNSEFSIPKKININYSGKHVSLYTLLLHFYCYVLHRNVAADLPKSSVTIRELFKPTYVIIRQEFAVRNVTLLQRKCFPVFLELAR